MIDSILAGYIDAALFFTDDENGTPLADNHDEVSIASDTLASMRRDCEAFIAECRADIEAADIKIGPNMSDYRTSSPRLEQVGHDLWLTRNGHGAGFWDGDYSEPQASRLSQAARKLGSVDLYVGDDGLLYC